MNDKLILIKTFNSPIDANIAKGLLESNNIEGILFDENIVYTNPIYTTAVGGVKLLVRESDYESALKLFNETQKHSDRSNEKLECPQCNSIEVISKYKYNWIALLVMLISFSFTPKAGGIKKYNCKKCNFIWEDRI